MSLDRIEMSKQMQRYADAITAFAIVQAVGTCLLIGQGERLACFVKSEWHVAAPIVAISYVIYGVIVRACQLAEMACSADGVTDGELRAIAAKVRIGRLLLLSIAGAGLGLLIVYAGITTPPPCKN
jgi:hypothetical protein